jgi:hypothetical protein
MNAQELPMIPAKNLILKFDNAYVLKNYTVSCNESDKRMKIEQMLTRTELEKMQGKLHNNYLFFVELHLHFYLTD